MSTRTHSANVVNGISGASVIASDEKERIAWIDFAKGLCIFAVVMMYATHHVQQLLRTEGWMQHVVDFAQPFRMPDFFLLAGLFVARVIDRPLRRYIDTKVLYFFYFYSIWVTFRFAYTDLRTMTDTASLVTNYLWLYVEPPSGPLWFIYLLALFFISVRLLRNISPIIVLAAAVVLHLVELKTGYTLVDKYTHYFVFFYAGHLFRDQLFQLADWAQQQRKVVLGLLTVWFFANGFLVFDGWSAHVAVSLLLGFAGAIAILLFATLCVRTRSMRWLAYLGQHSIVVYLGFVVPLALMRGFIVTMASYTDVGSLTLLVTLISIGGALLLYLAVRRTPVRFIFKRPAWLSLHTARPAQSFG